MDLLRVGYTTDFQVATRSSAHFNVCGSLRLRYSLWSICRGVSGDFGMSCIMPITDGPWGIGKPPMSSRSLATKSPNIDIPQGFPGRHLSDYLEERPHHGTLPSRVSCYMCSLTADGSSAL